MRVKSAAVTGVIFPVFGSDSKRRRRAGESDNTVEREPSVTNFAGCAALTHILFVVVDFRLVTSKHCGGIDITTATNWVRNENALFL